MIPLGSKVKDRFSGFTGIATGRTQWMTGCATVIVQPEVGKDGKLPEAHSFDEPNLDILKSVETTPIAPAG